MLIVMNIQAEERTLYLKGILTSDTINAIWGTDAQQLANIDYINVSQLDRVDSSGLALMVYFCIKYEIKLIKPTPQLKSLIDLYDLTTVVL